MKKKDKDALKNKSAAELLKLVADAKSDLQKLRFDLDAGKVKNVREVKERRKNIARMLTAIKMQSPAGKK